MSTVRPYSRVSHLPRRHALSALLILVSVLPSRAITQETEGDGRAIGFGFSIPIPDGFSKDSVSKSLRDSLKTLGIVEPVTLVANAHDARIVAGWLMTPAKGFGECQELSELPTAQTGPVELELQGRPACQVALRIDDAVPRYNVYTFIQDSPRPDIAELDTRGVIWCIASGQPIERWCDEVSGDFRVALDPAKPFSEWMLTAKPERLSCPQLPYPEMLQQANIERTVLLEFVVGLFGRAEPSSFTVISSEPETAGAKRQFENAATAMVEACLFRPGRIGEMPVRVLVQIPIVFHLRRR